MLPEAKSKWCADFFRNVRGAHRGMSRTNWFRWKVIGFMEGELQKWTDEMATIDEFKAELLPKDLVRFEETVFAPRVRWLGLFPCVVYHAFAPFGGIYRRVAGWPRWLCRLGRRKPIVEYMTQVRY